MRLEALHYLLEIAKTQSISISADNLQISRSALSKAIKILEDELQMPLLRRAISEVQLTSEAKALLPRIKDILADYYALINYVKFPPQQVPEDLGGTLAIFVGTAIAEYYLPKVLSVFCRRYPKAKLNIYEQNILEDIPQMLQSRRADLIIALNVVGDVAPQLADDGIVAEALIYERLFVTLSHHSPLAGKRMLTFEDLLAEKLIFEPNISSPEKFFGTILGLSPTPDIFLRSSNPKLIKELLAEDKVACVMLSHFMATHFMQDADFVCIPIKTHLKFQTTCLYRHAPQQPLLQAFMAILRHYSHQC